jgi:hypothetical protein
MPVISGPYEDTGHYLRANRAEILEAVAARITAIERARSSAGYKYGARELVEIAVDYAIGGLESDAEVPIPESFTTRAQQAACDRVGLELVFRHLVSAQAILVDFTMRAVEDAGAAAPPLRSHLQAIAGCFDGLIAVVSEAHASRVRVQVHEARQLRQVTKLLEGEFLETPDLDYRLDGYHVGVIAGGPGAEAVIQAAARKLGCRLLLLRNDERTLWAWFGTSAKLRSDDLEIVDDRESTSQSTISIGEPGADLSGWRLTHEQAQAALPIARQTNSNVVRYGEVMILAATLRDNLLARSLREIFLAPLAEERGGGSALGETLRAYLAADHNASSAAARLGVDRHTVASRIRQVERSIKRPLHTCLAELQAALDLEDLAGSRPPENS